MRKLQILVLHIMRSPIRKHLARVFFIIKKSMDKTGPEISSSENKKLKLSEPVAESIVEVRRRSVGVGFNTALGLQDGVVSLRQQVLKLNCNLSELDWSDELLIEEENELLFHELTYFSWVFGCSANRVNVDGRFLCKCLRKLESTTMKSWKSHYAWSPMSCSQRLINLLAYMSLSRLDEAELAFLKDHINKCQRIVEKYTEWYLGYNHLLFCLAAKILWYSAAQDKKNAISTSEKYILELRDQLHDDGMHRELSPTYHLHVRFLSSLVEGVLDDEESQLARRISRYSCRMDAATKVLLMGDGEVGVLSDSALHDAPSASHFVSPGKENKLLASSGYLSMYAGSIKLLMDVGSVGAYDNPGHGHSDQLSVNLSVKNQRLIEDYGVESYSAGAGRDRTRSSKFHNGPAFQNFETNQIHGGYILGKESSVEMISYTPTESDWMLKLYSNDHHIVRRKIKSDNEVISIADFWYANSLEPQDLKFIVPDEWSLNINDSTIFAQNGADKAYLIFPSVCSIVVEKSRYGYYPSGPSSKKACKTIIVRPSLVERIGKGGVFVAGFAISTDEKSVKNYPLEAEIIEHSKDERLLKVWRA